MTDYQITWESDPRGNGNGELCKVAKWGVGLVFYSGCVSRGDPKKYVAKCRLPGIKSLLGYYETVDSAKERVEEAVHHWFRAIFFDTKEPEPFNPDLAPPGYTARPCNTNSEEHACSGCDFWPANIASCVEASCLAQNRPDRTEAIMIKKTTDEVVS